MASKDTECPLKGMPLVRDGTVYQAKNCQAEKHEVCLTAKNPKDANQTKPQTTLLTLEGS